MRLRERRRIEKRARILAHRKTIPIPEFRGAGPEDLLRIAMDPKSRWRDAALEILAPKKVPEFLIQEFYAADDAVEIWGAGLTIGRVHFTDILERLTPALHDNNPERRRAAVAALAGFHNQRAPIAKALTAVIQDQTQPQLVREEACDSLTHYYWPQATPALINALREPAVGMRFWAAFGLGSMRHGKSERYDPRAVAALESALRDCEENPGWWSVGKEALGILAHVDPKYRQLCDQETKRILTDPASSKQDRGWAEFYGK